MKHILGNIATMFTILAYVPYITQILRRKTIPSQVTWFVLLVMGIVSFFTYKSIGAQNTLGIALANVVGPFLVLLLTILLSHQFGKRSDLKYLSLSFVALLLWWATSNALLGLAFNLLADFLGFLPTIKKSIFEPNTEDLLTWTLFVLGSIIGLFSLENYSFSLLIYPLYIALAEGLVLIFLIKAHLFRIMYND